jgi:alpha-tubulin suppressor-like RCC1 family protein
MKRFCLFSIAAIALAGCEPVVGPVPAEGGFIAVGTGDMHSCGVAASGALFCWGSNHAGQLGNGTTRGSAVPARVGGPASFVLVTGGDEHTCGLDRDGGLYCWGGNARGQLGTGSRERELLPVVVAPAIRFASVSAGAYHTCAVSVDGTGYCWGAALDGQTGQAPGPDIVEPEALPAGITFRSIAAGGAHSCGVDTTGTAYCWGSNAQGQLGDSASLDRWRPAPVHGGARYVEIDAGYRHTCAIRDNGEAQCWGSNAHGELGEGALPDPNRRDAAGATFPYTVQGISRASDITAGRYISCLNRRHESTTWCWGRGTEGQLGTGAYRDYQVAHRVYHGDLTFVGLNFRQLSAGGAHVCGVTATNSIFCWGRGDAGQLGAGSIMGSPLAVRVANGP